MSLVAVTLSTIKSVETWEQDELDFILFSGDGNHGSILADLGRIADPNQRVGVYELIGRRVTLSLGSRHFIMEGCAETDGLGVVSAIDPQAGPMGEFGMVSFSEALQTALLTTDGAVLTVGDYSTAIIPDPEGGLRVWDSHSRGPGGMFHPDGRAVLTQVENLLDLEELIRLQLIQRGCPAEQFEVLGFRRVLGGT
ncbi:uncharacterized protein LOC135465660 [Liolophura sinensis]|uniref:uncharacterized protein LOC135465660 n=1 Tax=Liolophura sinensis TaxID=3198878 RepID=UPI003158C119